MIITTTILLFLQGYCTSCKAFNGLQQSFYKRSSQTTTTTSSSNGKTITTLRGGYDSTIGPDPSNPIQFFTFENGMCPYAARTRIVLEELGLPYDIVAVTATPKPDWYLKINPRGKVPALRVPYDNNEVVYESAICDEYLCDLYDSQNNNNNPQDDQTACTLMPKNPIEKAKIRLLNDRCDTELNPSFFTFLMNKDFSKYDELSNKLHNSLMEYEDHLNMNGGPYMNGKEFTLADVHLLPFFLRIKVAGRYFKNFFITHEKYPKLTAWFELCSQRESVKVVAKSDEEIIDLYRKFIEVDYSFGGLNKNKGD